MWPLQGLPWPVRLAGAWVIAVGMLHCQGELSQAAASHGMASAAAGGQSGALDSQRCVPGQQLTPSWGWEPGCRGTSKTQCVRWSGYARREGASG